MKDLFLDKNKINVKELLKTDNDAIAGKVKPPGFTGSVLAVVLLQAEKNTEIVSSWCVTDENDPVLNAYLINKYKEPEEPGPEKTGENGVEFKLPERQRELMERAVRLYEKRKAEFMERERAVLAANGRSYASAQVRS
jgi:hypothetical protein